MVSFNIIVAFTAKKFGIGKNNSLPWHIQQDLKHFQNTTLDSIVVMGRKTYESIPENNRPLKNRINVIITSYPNKYKSTDQVIYVTLQEVDVFVNNLAHKLNKNVYYIGGYSIYRHFMGYADSIIATIIENDFECDTFFPIDKFNFYSINHYSELLEENDIKYRIITYKKIYKPHDEFQYLDNLKHILENGNERDDRTNTGTLSTFGNHITFDISKNFPLITTKFVGYKSILKELLFFIRGHTDSKILEDQGVSIWKANTTREFLDSRGLHNYDVGWLGEMYGYNWRFFGHPYQGANINYEGKGFDQLAHLIDGLKTDPFSRRHLLTTFNPATVSRSVLAPCHGLICQFYVEVDKESKNKKLSCQMYQRSVDNFLGFPYNIASYTMLTYIIAKICDMIPNKLIISMGDSHIYKNHVEQVQTQLKRSPFPFPVLEVKDSIKNKNINDIELDDFNLIGYLYHPAIKAPMAV